MKRNRGRLIPILLAAAVLLLAGCGFLFSRLPDVSAAESSRTSYFEKLSQYIENGINPLTDEEVEQTVRSRLEDFSLTADEADAIITTLNSGQADERYRDLYLVSIFEYDCNTKENHATSYYSEQDNTVHIGKNVAPNHFISTFFHETGHAIQISLWEKDTEASDKADTFRFPVEKEIYESLLEDVKNGIYSCYDGSQDYEYSSVQLQAIADAFINGSTDPVYDTEDPEEAKVLEEACEYAVQYLQEEMSEIPNSNASMVSDIFGGVTNNKILGGMGHPSFRINPDGTSSYYWYDGSGETTYNQLTEGWAEHFSAKVTGDIQNIEWNEQFFPEASGGFETLAGQLFEYYFNY